MVQNVPKWLKRFKITWMAESSPKIQSPSLFRIAENWLETQFLLLLSNHQAWTLIIKSLRWYLHLWWTSWKWTLRILWLFDYLWLSLMFFLSFLSDPSPIIVYPCHWLTHWLTDSLLFSRLYWCDPGGRWQLKTCWCCNYCWWWSCWQQLVAEVWSKS